MQDQQFNSSQEAFEYACKLRGYNPAALLPDTSKMPDWLAKKTIADIMRLIIAEAINGGRLPKFDEKEITYEAVFYIKKDPSKPSGFGFRHSSTLSGYVFTGVGARLKFFKQSDCDYFRTNFIDLHEAALLS
jgi:hypothetical protein